MSTELTIESLAYTGNGVGRAAGKVWFVPFTHPGDRILAAPEKEKKNYVQGRLETILTPSEKRIEPRCPHFGSCGGCHWQMASYPVQLEAKKQIVTENITRSGVPWTGRLELLKSPELWGYRNRIQMRITPEGTPGFYSPGSWNLLPVETCPLASPAINEKLKNLWEEGQNDPKILQRKYPRGFECRENLDGSVQVLPLGAPSIDPGDFSQVNTAVNSLLQNEVLDALDAIDPERNDFKILDLYCGDGNLSRPLAGRASEITGWDGSGAAVSRGNREAAELRKKFSGKIKYRRGFIEKFKKEIRENGSNADILILDPPRKGLKGVADFISTLGIKNLLYISCSPPDLNRDLKLLGQEGYRIEKAVILDMFPQTYHVETFIRLQKD